MLIKMKKLYTANDNSYYCNTSLNHTISMVCINTVFFLLLNPFLRFLQLPIGEIDPLGSILTLPFATDLILRRKVKTRLSYVYVLIFLILVYALFEITLNFGDLNLYHFLFSLSLIILPLSSFIFVDYYKNLFSTRLFNLNLYLWTAIATIQVSFPYFKIPILNELLSRGVLSDENLSSGRGVQSMAVEPAAVTYFIVFFIFYSIHLFKSDRITKSKLYVNLFASLALIFFTRSATLLTNLLLILLIYCLTKLKQSAFVTSILLLTVLPLVVFVLSLIGGRFNDFTVFFSSYDFSSSSLDYFIVDFTQKLDGGRLASSLASYNTLRMSPLGLGISNYEENFRNSWIDLYGSDLYLRDSASRASTYAGHIMTTMGIPGITSLILVHCFFFLRSVNSSENLPEYKIISFCLAIFWIYLSSIVTLPIPWIILALIQ